MKKTYNKPHLSLLPTKCHISTLKPDEDIDNSKRSLITKVGLFATVGHISLYGGSDTGPGFYSTSYNEYQAEKNPNIR